MSSLYVKRHYEKPKRPFKIWALDASKQGSGALVAHVFNIIMALILVGGANPNPDQCAWYLTNFVFDAFLGVFILWFFQTRLTQLAQARDWAYLKTPGGYGLESPLCYKIWAVQCLAWWGLFAIEKIILGLMIYAIRIPLGYATLVIFAPLQGHPHLELVVVMIGGPCLLNIFMFWACDVFLKKDESKNQHWCVRVFGSCCAKWYPAPNSLDEEETTSLSQSSISSPKAVVPLYGTDHSL